MLILVTYDVNTEDEAGRARLRKVAKMCVKHGQNSVFECILNEAQYVLLKHQLCEIIDAEKDSLRFYNLGNKYQNKTEHFGAKASYEAEGVLLL